MFAVFMKASLAPFKVVWKLLEGSLLCRVGDNSSATSAEYFFKTGKVVGQFVFPARIGLIGDLGITSNSSVSLQHLAANKPDIALFVGGALLLDAFVRARLLQCISLNFKHCLACCRPAPIGLLLYLNSIR